MACPDRKRTDHNLSSIRIEDRMAARKRQAAVSLGARVTAEIGRRITSGRIAPGATLPTEDALCKSLEVSRTTLREAVKNLHGKGLVEVGPRHGTRVLPAERWNQLDTDILSWRIEAGLDDELIDQLYQLRHCFEPYACELAAMHGDVEDRRRIREAFEGMCGEAAYEGALVDPDLDFHMAIVAATRNVFFNSVGAAIKTSLRMAFALGQERSKVPPAELALHGEVCEAILARNGAAAAEAMRTLLAASRASLKETIGGRQSAAPAEPGKASAPRFDQGS
jgi:DNA-binding FadR family transcriptional regulator